MDGQDLQKVANEYARELPEVTFEHRVAPNWEVYKVGGKVFMLMTDMPGHPVVIVKADPDDAVGLREQYAEITVGYHMDKKHWITAAGGPGLDEDLVKELVADSYRLVVDKLPKIRAAGEPGRLKPETRN
jgi:predicted DNA-binding protein (MmcQ/YjbR family)